MPHDMTLFLPIINHYLLLTLPLFEPCNRGGYGTTGTYLFHAPVTRSSLYWYVPVPSYPPTRIRLPPIRLIRPYPTVPGVLVQLG